MSFLRTISFSSMVMILITAESHFLAAATPSWREGKVSKNNLKERLTEIQYRVTQEDATEPPFKNEFWDNKKAGIYVDVVSGEPLFSSLDKFDSGTGWPSFTKPLVDQNIVSKRDFKLIWPRTEVRSKLADSHLGHVFDDGPKPTGKRYCINSAALRFIAADNLKDEGYSEYAALFAKNDRQAESATSELAMATFAGGCFWCMEPPFEKLAGVNAVVSGYIGGHDQDPTYDEVSAGATGHTEAVQITYDPSQITYEELLKVFWRQIDPTAADRQFVDVGSQYRPGIFYHSDEQRRLAEQSKEALSASGRFDKPIVVEITEAGRFFEAEEYHQDYYKKNPVRYKFYRFRSGRDQYLEQVWGSKKKS